MTYRADWTDWVYSKGIYCAIVLLILTSLAGSAGCSLRTTPPKQVQDDPQLEQLNRAARLAFDKNRYTDSEKLYRLALRQALLRDDFSEIVDARFNLSVCLLKLQDIIGARLQLNMAKNEFSRAKLTPPPSFALLEATILYREEKPEQAWSVTAEILTVAKRTTREIPSDLLARTYYLRGRIAGDQGDREGIQEAIDAMGQPEDLRLVADLEELKGRLALLQQRWETAIAAFDRAANLQRRLLEYHAMAEQLVLAARACEYGQKLDSAANRYLRAGRIAALLGNRDQALNWLAQAADLSEASGDENTAREARNLIKDLVQSKPV